MWVRMSVRVRVMMWMVWVYIHTVAYERPRQVVVLVVVVVAAEQVDVHWPVAAILKGLRKWIKLNLKLCYLPIG